MASGETPKSVRGSGTSRVLAKLNAAVEGGDYYEAHQMYRTLYARRSFLTAALHRYNAQKKYAEAIDLLYSGALILFKHGQHESGSDLAHLLIEIFKNASTPVTKDSIDKVSTIHKHLDSRSENRPQFVQEAVQWSRQVEARNATGGHPELHRSVAVTLWKEGDFSQARYHFLRSSDGETCATMLIEYHSQQGFPNEVDLFIAQAVLQFLCLQNQSTANAVFECYTRRHPMIGSEPPFLKPLLNFLWFLLLAVNSRKLTVFTVLCEQYQLSIERDPMYKEYLDRIGQLFFGVPKPHRPKGMFDNLISSLFGEEEDQPTQSATPSRRVITTVEELD